jgi:hypothetical protein
MRFFSPTSLFAVLSLCVATTRAIPGAAQTASPAAAATAPTPGSAAVAAPTTAIAPAAAATPAPPPILPLTEPLTGLALMPPAKLADLAAERIRAASHRLQDYIYLDTEHNQNYIEGALVVDHTTVSESIFIGGLPYLRKISVDGHPLAGKDLAQENKLYDNAVKERTSLNEDTRARLMKHSLGKNTDDLDHLDAHYKIEVPGHQILDDHDCLIIDAVPLPGTVNTALQRHIQIAIDQATRNVINVHIEYLADDNGFLKGTLLNTRYHLLGGTIALPYAQTMDSVVQIPQLLNKKIHVVKSHTYSDYRKFRATVTIENVEGPPPPENPPTTHP